MSSWAENELAFGIWFGIEQSQQILQSQQSLTLPYLTIWITLEFQWICFRKTIYNFSIAFKQNNRNKAELKSVNLLRTLCNWKHWANETKDGINGWNGFAILLHSFRSHSEIRVLCKKVPNVLLWNLLNVCRIIVWLMIKIILNCERKWMTKETKLINWL